MNEEDIIFPVILPFTADLMDSIQVVARDLGVTIEQVIGACMEVATRDHNQDEFLHCIAHYKSLTHNPWSGNEH